MRMRRLTMNQEGELDEGEVDTVIVSPAQLVGAENELLTQDTAF